MITQNRRLAAIVFIAIFLLAIPLIAMQFTPEVNWTLSDFVAAGVLLLGTGLTCELVLRKVKKFNHRVILCLTVLAIGFLVWLELAVGIFGTPLAGS